MLSDQLHATVALTPRKVPWDESKRRPGGLQVRSGRSGEPEIDPRIEPSIV